MCDTETDREPSIFVRLSCYKRQNKTYFIIFVCFYAFVEFVFSIEKTEKGIMNFVGWTFSDKKEITYCHFCPIHKPPFEYLADLISGQGRPVTISALPGIRTFIVYFDQRTGAPNAVRWLKSIFLMLKQLFPSLTEQNKEKRKKSHTKKCNKRGVYQHLGVTL